MKVFRESPKINSNNLLGSSFFRVKLRGREHLTKMSQASQPLILSAKVTIWMSREGNVVICLRSLRTEAFLFLVPQSSRVSVFLHWSYYWKWTLEVTHSMSRWWGYPEFYRDSCRFARGIVHNATGSQAVTRWDLNSQSLPSELTQQVCFFWTSW